MSEDLAKTPLHAWHASHHARLIDFVGWSMPVLYDSITAEHLATRQAVTLFDISHMGRLTLQGADAASFLNGLLTRRVDNLPGNRIRYSLVTGADGGILDDVLVYHLADQGRSQYRLVVNASNREKIVGWLRDHLSPEADVQLSDTTRETAMIAVQGPHAMAAAERVLPQASCGQLRYYTATCSHWQDQPLLVSRTGYTGEDGVELICPASVAEPLWIRLLEAGRDLGAQPAGLGARDTLRLEAGMPLYGHELSEEITPWTAGLDFAVDLPGRSFPGHEALLAAQARPRPQTRVGLVLNGRRAPRENYAVLDSSDQRIGHVTSGTHSPTMQRPIAMAYVQTEFSRPGQSVQVDLRGRTEQAEVVGLPFYRRAHKGSSS